MTTQGGELVNTSCILGGGGGGHCRHIIGCQTRKQEGRKQWEVTQFFGNHKLPMAAPSVTTLGVLQSLKVGVCVCERERVRVRESACVCVLTATSKIVAGGEQEGSIMSVKQSGKGPATSHTRPQD